MAIYSSGNISFFTVASYNSNSLFTIFSNLDAHNGSTDLLFPSLFKVEGFNSNTIFTIFSNLDAHNGSTDLLTPSIIKVEGFNSNSVFTSFSNKKLQEESIFITTNDSRPKSSFSWR